MLFRGDDASGSDSSIGSEGDVGPVLDAGRRDGVLVLGAEPLRFGEGMIFNTDILVDEPLTSPVVQSLWLWDDPTGCERFREEGSLDSVLRLAVNVHFPAGPGSPPGEGVYPVVGRGLMGRPLGVGESEVIFVPTDSSEQIEGTMGSVTVESVTAEDVTAFVDATLADGTVVRGRVTVGICAPRPTTGVLSARTWPGSRR